MYIWALKKHRRYRKEFGDKYPRGRKGASRSFCPSRSLELAFPRSAARRPCSVCVKATG